MKRLLLAALLAVPSFAASFSIDLVQVAKAVKARHPDEGASTAIQAAEAEVARLKAVSASAAVPTISEVAP